MNLIASGKSIKWIVEGANPQTGKALVREVEAESEGAAEELAHGKGMLVSSVRRACPACYNCDRKFGRLESSVDYEGHQICAACLEILERPSIDAPASRRTIPSVLPRACPVCGSKTPPVRRAKGSLLVLLLLLLIGALPGILHPIFYSLIGALPAILYLIFYSGHVFVCPKCGMKVADAG